MLSRKAEPYKDLNSRFWSPYYWVIHGHVKCVRSAIVGTGQHFTSPFTFDNSFKRYSNRIKEWATQTLSVGNTSQMLQLLLTWTRRVRNLSSVTERCLHLRTTWTRTLATAMKWNEVLVLYSNEIKTPNSLSHRAHQATNQQAKINPSINPNFKQIQINLKTFCHLTSLLTHSVTAARRDQINMLFAKAIHETLTSFSFFEHPSWVDFFKESSPSLNPLPPRNIGSALLDDFYNSIMINVVESIQKSNGGILGIYGQLTDSQNQLTMWSFIILDLFSSNIFVPTWNAKLLRIL